jgi:hypothetical protein
VFTEIGPVEVEVPRHVNASFDPQIAKVRQRRLTGIDEFWRDVSRTRLADPMAACGALTASLRSNPWPPHGLAGTRGMFVSIQAPAQRAPGPPRVTGVLVCRSR